jgi:hypothetical protein
MDELKMVSYIVQVIELHGVLSWSFQAQQILKISNLCSFHLTTKLPQNSTSSEPKFQSQGTTSRSGSGIDRWPVDAFVSSAGIR